MLMHALGGQTKSIMVFSEMAYCVVAKIFCIVSFFTLFYFSGALQSDNNIKEFWTLLRAHFNPCLGAWTKTSLRRAQNIFMLANINSIVFLLSSHENNIFLMQTRF